MILVEVSLNQFNNSVLYDIIELEELLGDNMTFHDQTFIKNNTTLERKEKALNKLIQLRPNNKNISQELFMVQKGLEGERKIAYQLSKSNLGMYIFHDIKLQYKDLTAQIDYMVFTSKACYFIEAKNYTGNIKIDENGNFIREYNYNGKKIKKGMDSPIRQVEAQLEVFTKIALFNEDRMKELLKGTKFTNYFKTLVVFTDEETILEMNKAPNDIKSRVVRYDGLLRKIEQINSKQENVINSEQLKEFIDFISSLDQTIEENYEEYYMNKFYLSKDESSLNLIRATSNNRRNNTKYYKNKKKLNKKLIIGIVSVWILLSIYSSTINNNKAKKNIELTGNQRQAISIIKSAYNNSKQNGFEIIHTSVCNELKNMFSGNTFNCNRLPLEVNFLNENQITIYKDYWCYTLELSKDGNKLVNTKRRNTKCNGYAVGYLEWDENNEYYQKIGGYNKIKEMAVYSYNNNAFVHDYLDYSHIGERGGDPNYKTTYMMQVDMFFGALTSKGYSVRTGSTNKEETNKMCESLYYIMK